MSDSDTGSMDARAAELLARQINTAFTMVSGYGPRHPMFEKACEALHESLQEALAEKPTISLLLDRGALFIDKFPVGQRFNPRRLMNQLAQLGIESISFARGLAIDELRHLLVMSADAAKYPKLDALQEGLEDQGVSSIRLNYIVFRQVTTDQKIVAEDDERSETDDAVLPLSGSEQAAESSDSFGVIASLLSLDELVKDPDGYAEKLQEHGSDDAQRRQLVRQLRNLISQVERGEIKGGSALSSEAVLGAVNDLRSRVRRNLDTKRDVEVILSEQDQVMGEIDQLTYSTLVSLIREEFRGGKFSAGRMAQIINRMLPDARDLKRLLPQLKQGLLAEGMTMAEWGKLVGKLSSELRGEHLVKALEQGAESVGLDVDEIVEQIKEDPSEAARLIVMATELRRSGAEDEEQLSAAFSDYIERISDKLSLELGQGDPRIGGLDSQLLRVRQLLVDQLNRQGLPPELIESVRARLQSKSAMPDAVPVNQEHAERETAAEAAAQSDPVAEEVELEGESDSAAESQPSSAHETARPLPSRVLNPTNTAFFLNREIKSSQRYGTPFSVVKVSVELVRDRPGTPRSPNPADLGELMPQVYHELIDQLRDLDLIGSLDKKYQAIPLMILPMTPASGVDIVLNRLIRRLAHTPFRLGNMPVQLHCAVSSASFEAEKGESGQAFIERMAEEHEVAREMLHLDHGTTPSERARI